MEEVQTAGLSREEEKKQLLVIPGMYPRYPGDIFGVFVMDYIESIRSYYDVSVLAGRVVGHKISDQTDWYEPWPTYRFSIFDRKIPGFLKLLSLPFWFKKSWNILESLNNVHVVHTHNVLFETLLAIWYGRAKKVPVVVTVHTGPFSKLMKPPIMGMLTKWILEQVDAVLVVSDDVRMQIEQERISPKRIEVTYNPVDTDLFALPSSDSDRPKNLLFVGRLEDYKGALRTVKAFNKVSSSLREWTLTIVGDGPEKEDIEHYIEKNPDIKERVFLKGQLQKEAIAEEMRCSSIFVFPSEHETFGIVIAEAMATGLPVIVGDATAPKEFVDEESGVLVPPDSVQAIADAMAYVIRYQERFDSACIRQKIVKKFGFNVFGERLMTIYGELDKKAAHLIKA